MPWFENDSGNRLWYEEHGTGTPIILIHGWCMSSAVWKFQVKGLSDSFRVITIDLRGHGNSPAHPDGFHVNGSVSDIIGLIGKLDVKGAIVAGWSLGALIAIETCLLHKECVSGVVLISGTPRFVRSVDFPFGLSQAEAEGMAKKVHRNVFRAREGFLNRVLAAAEDESGCIRRLLSSVFVPSAAVALEALEALVNADVRVRLASIACPALIISGDSDVICLPQASAFLSRQIPHSQLVVFSGCGHVPFLTQSRKFNECLENFRDIVNGGGYRQE